MCSLEYAARPVTCWMQPRVPAFGPTPRFFSRTQGSRASGALARGPWRRGAVQRLPRRSRGTGAGGVSSASGGRRCPRRRLLIGRHPLTHVLLAGVRKAVPSLLAVPRVSIRHLPHRHGFFYRDAAVDSAGAVADRPFAGVPDRPAHSRRRPQVAPQESRHADHGRAADRRVDPLPRIVVGQSEDAGRVGVAGRTGELRRGRIPGRLHEGSAQAQSRLDGAAKVDLWRSEPRCWWAFCFWP